MVGLQVICGSRKTTCVLIYKNVSQVLQTCQYMYINKFTTSLDVHKYVYQFTFVGFFSNFILCASLKEKYRCESAQDNEKETKRINRLRKRFGGEEMFILIQCSYL